MTMADTPDPRGTGATSKVVKPFPARPEAAPAEAAPPPVRPMRPAGRRVSPGRPAAGAGSLAPSFSPGWPGRATGGMAGGPRGGS